MGVEGALAESPGPLDFDAVEESSGICLLIPDPFLAAAAMLAARSVYAWAQELLRQGSQLSRWQTRWGSCESLRLEIDGWPHLLRQTLFHLAMLVPFLLYIDGPC